LLLLKKVESIKIILQCGYRTKNNSDVQIKKMIMIFTMTAISTISTLNLKRESTQRGNGFLRRLLVGSWQSQSRILMSLYANRCLYFDVTRERCQTNKRQKVLEHYGRSKTQYRQFLICAYLLYCRSLFYRMLWACGLRSLP